MGPDSASDVIRDGREALASQYECRKWGVSITVEVTPESSQWDMLVSAPDDPDAAHSDPARGRPETTSCDPETGQKERPEKSCVLPDAAVGNGLLH